MNECGSCGTCGICLRDRKIAALEAELARLRGRIFGRLLLPSEIAEFAAAADSDYCAACGLKWEEHRVYCEGSAAGRGEGEK